MTRNRPSAAVLVAILALLAGSPAAAEPTPLSELLTAQGIQPIDPPTAAPDFTLPLVTGGEGELSASHGDWVVLTFFATWCGPCRSEMPTLERLHRSLGGDGVTLLAVSVDSRRDPVGPYLEEHDLTLPVFWDHRGQVGNAYRATSIPVSYVIDPTGQIVGMSRGARDWSVMVPLFDALREARPASADSPSRYATLDGLELPEVLEPPTAEWSLPEYSLSPGRPFTLEIRLSWSGRLEDYLPQPPQIPLPDGMVRGRVAASSSSLDRSQLVRYQIELTATEAGVYELDPIELRYLPAASASPVAARVAGPTLEVAADGGGSARTALVALLALAIAASLWLYRRRVGGAGEAPTPAELAGRLRGELDRAKALRLAGDTGAGYEMLVATARELESPEERQDLERRLESVRFGGDLPDSAELEAIERRLERAIARSLPDPDEDKRRRLRLRSRTGSSSPLTSKEIPG